MKTRFNKVKKQIVGKKTAIHIIFSCNGNEGTLSLRTLTNSLYGIKNLGKFF